MVEQLFAPHTRSTSTTIGWPEQKGPLCATWPAHRGLLGGYPVSIQSFIRFFREDGSSLRITARSFLTP